MKAQVGLIIHQEQEDYLERLLPERDLLLREMERFADAHGIPIADPEVAMFLEITTRAIRATRVLEVGTAIGYADIFMARAMAPQGRVVTIDTNTEMIEKAKAYVKRAGLEDRVEFHEGPALTVIPTLDGPFDLVYLDAVKGEYRGYLDLALPLIRVGGVVVCDNVLWRGQVASGRLFDEQYRQSTEALRGFNDYFVHHPQMLAQILPLGDGLAYSVKVK
ncbi:O-methyltransferase [Candidatus Methylomirabilis lanthanidiphila]|uniref:tRNA 5-hydroxyuridine methyltransferase n=1 Tax=Candidatus Methylomirabilis lanthanidiphila TaxID=2211376 RepID=A0A564ZHF7_9BACT|nr:O-methyltransferase [Candidatus Methylomirabilis lanthanidiphila]VUZ84724.1 O-methyltransferase [Candidatus Methylomirabilis lanthanidiphila]